MCGTVAHEAKLRQVFFLNALECRKKAPGSCFLTRHYCLNPFVHARDVAERVQSATLTIHASQRHIDVSLFKMRWDAVLCVGLQGEHTSPGTRPQT